MSVVKKISFGNGQLNQFMFTPSSANVINRQEVSSKQNSDSVKSAKTMSYVSAATALASLGVAGVAIVKSIKKPKNIEALTKEGVAEMINPIRESVGKLAGDFKNTAEGFTKLEEKMSGEVSNVHDRINKLGGEASGMVENAKRELSEQISGVARYAASQGPDGFYTCDVKVNGVPLKLANVYSEIYGEKARMLEKDLQSEAAKRILGLVDRSNKTPPEVVTVRMPTAEIRPFTSTGGMSVVPKELITNIAGLLNTKQKANLLLDTPLYVGNVSNNQFYRTERVFDENGKPTEQFKYIKNAFNSEKKVWEESTMTTIEKIDSMRLPIYTDKARNMENVDLYLSDELKSNIDFKLLAARLNSDVLEEIEKSVNTNKFWENDILKISKDPDTGEYVTQAKYKAVFYDSPKFDLAGRTNEKPTIYKNDAIETGETERFIYFAKFFSEHLMNGDNSKAKLGADLIIGNDWHTGPISAILRQLTTTRKYYGMDPVKADLLHDIPIVTIMHNAGLAGNTWHSHSKLLNIMFGEHATKIVTNSFMPNTFVKDSVKGLPNDLLNGLFTGDNVNPQMMAAAYSDILVPVSQKYGDEMASHSEYGKACHEIFKIRARKFEFADEFTLKVIAKNNGLNQESLSSQPTMVGVPNGCDPVNNTLVAKQARNLEEYLGLEKNSIWTLKDAGNNVSKWHRHNKDVYLGKVINDINIARTSNGVNNPMNIYLPENTDLTGVTADTPVFSSAGRFSDQKGLEIFAEGIKEFYKNYKGTEYPVFYIQGRGDRKFIQPLLDLKSELCKTNPDAAKRIVIADLFDEKGRYDGCKLMSDFTIMSSWFEPCGLVHKENAKFSGAIPICLDVGGLSAGLTNNVNALILDFTPRYMQDALQHNGTSLSGGMLRACEWMKDKAGFAKALESSQKTDHSWLAIGGPMDQYGKIFVDMKVFKPEVLDIPAKAAACT